jgi:Cft2 family RNA processing exonuclease
MKITFLGGADEVGASSILIEIGGRRLLVDAGIRPTPKARWGLAGDQLPDLSQIERNEQTRVRGIDAILVTHAHTDHTGALELVTERYPDVPVYATPVTIALTKVLHQDARRIMKMRLEEEGELPLYDEIATAGLIDAFRPVQFNQPLTLAPGLTATFFLAGHIAGAAMIGLSSAEGRILISGDISISPQRTVDGARPPLFRPDVLILESTYGGRLHANRQAEERRLVETISEVTAEGGKVLIPAFALGRAQEIMLTLGEFQRRGELAAIPVWADGMVRAICQAYSSFPEALPLALQEQGATFYTERIRPVTNAAHRNALTWEPGPAVIVSSSGMLAGGPSLAYARALAGGAQNAILLTGYQDEESPGRRLQEMAAKGRGTLRLGRDRIDVQCRLATYSLSAHADTGQLVSFVETLDPAQVFLVHGEEEARQSLAKALHARSRNVNLPRSGQSFDFSFTPLVRPQSAHGIGQGRPPDLRRLWTEVQNETGDSGWVTLRELAEIWWGDRPPPSAAQIVTLTRALTADDRYFGVDPSRPQLYRVRSRAQVALIAQRQAQMADHGDLHDRWLLVRDREGEVRVARVLEVAADHLRVVVEDAIEPGSAASDPFTVWPEDLLGVLNDPAEGAATLQRVATSLSAESGSVRMEPNQALALVNQHFPVEARLRRVGYRLDDGVLILTFDFPDTMRVRYAAEIEDLVNRSGWQIEITPEANQGAINLLVKESLPADWPIQKGPSLYRIEKRVAITVAPPMTPTFAQIQAAQTHFESISGYVLEISVIEAPEVAVEVSAPAGEPMEINAAYAVIKAALADSTLYRTSLKDGVILLSFISAQVGERYSEEIERLAQRIGWPLRINPQPNQNAILDQARQLLMRQNLRLVKGPSIFLDRGEVAITVADAVPAEAVSALQQEFEDATGFSLHIAASAGLPAPPLSASQDAAIIEIAVAQIHLTPTQQKLALNLAKLDNAIQRARRDGQIHPPLLVRRRRDGYLLLDGLYRLRAAQALGYSRIPAVVED